MIVILRADAGASELAAVVQLVESFGFTPQTIRGAQRTAVAVVGNDGRVDGARFQALPGVEEVIQLTRPYRMVAREWRPEPTVVRFPNGVSVGGHDLFIVAGPCAVESEV